VIVFEEFLGVRALKDCGLIHSRFAED